MPRIQLVLEYDGTAYAGWQTQKNGPSVEDRVRKALRDLLGEDVALSSATRTDSGAHALGQVACFSTERVLPLKAYWMGLGGLLPPDIAVVKASFVPENFDPRRHSKGKRYRYLIWNRRTRSPTRRLTHWQIFQPLDTAAMRRASAALVGRHDFSAFRAADCQAAHPVRELRALAVEGRAGEEIQITLEGTAFLKHMVRNIVGSLVEVGKGRQNVDWIAEVLASRDRMQAGPTAPPHGLTLLEVLYESEEEGEPL